MSPKLKELLFPNENRTFWGKRWVKVILLNLHLCGVCGFVAGKLFNVDVRLDISYYRNLLQLYLADSKPRMDDFAQSFSFDTAFFIFPL